MTDDDLVKRLIAASAKRDEFEAVMLASVSAERIKALSEQLEAARRDAKEAEAYAEEMEARLRDEGASLVKTIDNLQARLAEVAAELRFHVDDAVKAWSAHEAAETRAEAAEARVKESEAQPAPIAQAWIDADDTLHMQGRDGPEKAAADVYAALAGIVQPAPEGAVQRVQHIKRGTTYRVLGRGQLQTDTDLRDYDEVVAYQCEGDGRVWVRAAAEFDDPTRFRILPTVQPAPEVAQAAQVILNAIDRGKIEVDILKLLCNGLPLPALRALADMEDRG